MPTPIVAAGLRHAGIRRAGATVVPLDADSPVARQRHIVADSDSVAVVCAGPEAAPTPASVRALRAADLLDAGAGPLDDVDAPPQDPGFVFYTSGTTGLPKGVEVCDAGILRLAEPGWLRFEAGTRVASLSNPAFDALTFEVWTPLLTGGTSCANYSKWRAASLACPISPRATDSSPAAAIP